jgi:hypothetical protein
VHGVVAVRAVARAQVQVLQLGAEVVGTESVIGIRARYRGCGRGPPQRLRNLVRHIRGEHEDRGRRRELHGARLAAASRRHRQCGRPRDSKKYCRRTRLAEDRVDSKNQAQVTVAFESGAFSDRRAEPRRGRVNPARRFHATTHVRTCVSSCPARLTTRARTGETHVGSFGAGRLHFSRVGTSSEISRAMGPKKQEPESSASPKGKETASEPADEADEAGSGNAPPASEGAAASSGASVEASEPEMTKSAKKRQRKAEAKAAMRGMKTLIGDVKQGLAEKKQREAAHEGDVTPTEPEQETAPETVTPAIPKDGSPTPDEEERAASPPRPSPDEKRLGESRSRNPYATATESAAASALLSEAHAAYASRRVADAARLYEGAAAENGAGYAPLMALRAHEGDAAGALAALRSAAAVPGAATFAAQETRDMASALGRLFVTSAAARAGASRESRAAHISFPTPDGWFEPGRREENVAPLAARRLIADARPAMACGLTLRGLDPDRFGDETNKTNKTSASASSAMAAAEALRVARPDTKGWRLAARLLAAAGRALSGADASAAKACLMASAGVVAGGIGTAVPDPLEAVAESEWALASDETPGLDETLTEEARGVVVAAAADVCADRVIAAVAARVPSAQSLERHRFDADPDADGGFGGFGGFGKNRDGSSRPPAALVSALRALVGCVSATGASGAEAAHGALYRAADAVWALECLETYERKKAAHESQRATEVSESELGTAAVALASAAAPSNAFGWDPHVVLAFCAKSCASMASPAPELADAVASLAPPGASDALLSTLETLRGKAAEAAKRHTNKKDTPLGDGWRRVALRGGTRSLAVRRGRRRRRAHRGGGRRVGGVGGGQGVSFRGGRGRARVRRGESRARLAGGRRGDPADYLRARVVVYKPRRGGA